MSCPREMFVAACCKTDLDQVRSLLEEGSDVNWRRKQDGWSGLYWAARHNCQDLLQLLLAQRGLDVNIRDHLGRTPLMAACYHGHDGIARRLCQLPGLQLNSRDKHQFTALHFAVYGNKPVCVQVKIFQQQIIEG